MGTNYYAIPIANDDLKSELEKLLIEENWDEMKKKIPQRIHLGKSSFGWMFCFDHNYWEYFDESEESLIKFIDRCRIVDEYGRDHTPKDFWEMVQNKQLSKSSVHNEIHFGYQFSTGFS